MFEAKIAELFPSNADQVLADILRLLELANRLTAMGHLSMLNSEHADPELKYSANRNLLAIALTSAGYLAEVGNVVLSLRRAGITRHLSGEASTAWKELESIRKRVHREDGARKLRNKVGFHIDRDTMLEGVRGLESDEEVYLAAGDSLEAAHWHFDVATTTLLVGIGWLDANGNPEPDELGPVLRQIADDQCAVGQHVQPLLFELLGLLEESQ